MKLTVETEGKIIDFTVEYRKRRTLEIRILPPGNVFVISPKGLKHNKIKEIVLKKSKWILKKLDYLEEIKYEITEKKLENNEKFMYLGKSYPLKIEIDKNYKKKPQIKLERDSIYILTQYNDDKIIKKVLEEWYRKKAIEKIVERVEKYKKIVGREPVNIKVKSQKKRWGSCTSNGNVLFNWKLIMAPLEILDYVVVHELCHLVHMNHSRDFWQLVESIIPNYREKREWLKLNGLKLNF